MYYRVCDKFFVTKLIWQFYSSFCSQSKSGTFNNVRCVFILQDAFYDFKFVGLAGKSWVNCLFWQYSNSRATDFCYQAKMTDWVSKQCSALSTLVLPAWSCRHEIISRLTVEYSALPWYFEKKQEKTILAKNHHLNLWVIPRVYAFNRKIIFIGEHQIECTFC